MLCFMQKHLLRIPEFNDLPFSELTALACHAQIICVPAGRGLIRRGQPMSGYYYLIKGALFCETKKHILRSAGDGPLRHFYPGEQGIRSLTAVEVLYLDATSRAFALQKPQHRQMPVLTSDPWLERFLNSPLLQRVPRPVWQQLISGLSRQEIPAGNAIVKKGERGRHCFIIETGRAMIEVAQVTPAVLHAGDFFGEDALILGQTRRSTISAIDHVCVRILDETLFARALLKPLVTFVRHPSAGVRLNLSHRAANGSFVFDQSGAMSGPHDPHLTYYVSGGNAGERMLGAFQLIQRGLTAFPLA
jgi:CRP-like cAMP-binding protein